MKRSRIETGSDDIYGHLLAIDRQRRLEHAREGLRTEVEQGEVEVRVSVPNLHRWKIRLSLKLLTSLFLAVAPMTVGAVAVRNWLEEGASHRRHLEMIRKASGLSQAYQVEFSVVGSRAAIVTASIYPSFVSQVQVSHDDQRTWETIYPALSGGTSPNSQLVDGTLEHRELSIQSIHEFTALKTDERTVEVVVRATFAPAVLEAFPEYREPNQTDRMARYRLAPNRIELVNPGTNSKPPVLMGELPASSRRWERLNSGRAWAEMRSGENGRVLSCTFRLKRPGEYVIASHPLVGSDSTRATQRIEDLKVVELQLVYRADRPVTIETRLQDDEGRIVGAQQVLEPNPHLKTVLIPASSLKGYFNARSIDFKSVRRFELAVSRHLDSQAEQGNLEIQSVRFYGSGEPFRIEDGAGGDLGGGTTLYELPLVPPMRWRTAVGNKGQVELTQSGNLLVCGVELPYDEKADDGQLPWTNAEIDMGGRDLRALKAIELLVRWEGTAPVTLETMLTCSTSISYTYGVGLEIEPTLDFRRVLVCPNSLRFFWTKPDAHGHPEMDLGDVTGLGLGVSRKGYPQASCGKLIVKSIRFVGGVPEKRASTSG